MKTSIFKKVGMTALAFALCLSIAACGERDTDSGKAPPVEGVDTQAVIMTVNGNDVTVGEYLAFVRYFKRSMEAQYGLPFGSEEAASIWTQQSGEGVMLQDMADKQIKAQLAQMVITEQIAREHDFAITDEEEKQIELAVGAAVSSYADEAAFFAQTGIYPDDYYLIYKQSLLANKVVEGLFGYEGTEPAHVTGEDVKQSCRLDYVRIKHVLIQDEFQELAEADKDVQSIAENVLGRAKAGEDFDGLIDEFGEDPGAVGYPDGYFFTRGEMVQVFEDAAFEMEIGEIRMVQSNYGFHIMQKLDQSEEPFFAANAETVYSALIFEKGKTYLEQVAGQADVVMNEEVASTIEFSKF